MATLISCATGNFTTDTTWKVADATSLLDSEAGNTALTTSYVASAASTPGAITIDGIAVKLASRAASPTGTMSIKLYNSTDGADAAGTEVVVNVADLPTCSTTENEGGWFLVSFSAVTLTAAKNYQVHAKTSSASQVNLYRNATAGNWSRLLRTTTNAAPAATDVLHVMGEHTGAGTSNSFVVTMENTATTDFGAGTNDVVALSVSQLGTVNYAYSASTNYYLKLSGDLILYNGSTFTIGTVDNPIPRNSTAVLEFEPTSDNGMGIYARNGSTLTMQGLSRTSGKNVVSCKLNTDEAVAQTVLGVDTDTGWLSGDEIVIASTTRTATQLEKRTLGSDASATELTISAGLTNAHAGTAPVQAEVGLLTRNVKVRGTATNKTGHMKIYSTATVDIDWTGFYSFGGYRSDSYAAFYISTTTGSCNIQYSCIQDGYHHACRIFTNSNNVTISNNIFYNIGSSGSGGTVYIYSTIYSITFSNNLIIGGTISTGAYSFMQVEDMGSTITGNIITSITGGDDSSNALLLGEAYLTSAIGDISGNVIHSNSCSGVLINSVSAFGRQTIGSLTIYRNNFIGLKTNNSINGTIVATGNYTLNNLTAFGNNRSNIGCYTASGNQMGCFDLTFTNAVLNGDASFATTFGIAFQYAPGYSHGKMTFIDSSFGSTTTHSTADISVDKIGKLEVVLINTTLSSTEVSGTFNFLTSINSHKHDTSSTTFKSWYKYGIINSDTTIRHTASGYSWKMTPNTAGGKLMLPGPTDSRSFKSAVNGSGTVTISCYMYKDSSYNGSAPRLVLLGGLAGVTATSTALTVAHSNWENIIVTCTPSEAGVVEFYVECDGTAGNVYVDDFSVTQA